jgi:hypothetical protein
VTVGFLRFIKSQFTTNAQNVIHMKQYTYEHFWSRTLELFQKSRYGYESFDRSALVKCRFIFQLEFTTPEILSVPAERKPKDWGQANLRAVPRILTVCVHILMWNVSLFWCVKLTPKIYSNISDTFRTFNYHWALNRSQQICLNLFGRAKGGLEVGLGG